VPIVDVEDPPASERNKQHKSGHFERIAHRTRMTVTHCRDGAGGGSRTHTSLKALGILSPHNSRAYGTLSANVIHCSNDLQPRCRSVDLP
jgi:hypothetical protein